VGGCAPHWFGRLACQISSLDPRISVHKTGLLLVDSQRIVVPQALCQKILKVIHLVHLGLQRSLSLLKLVGKDDNTST
jgi:hypothetical protein